jgi:DNA-binding phage protein
MNSLRPLAAGAFFALLVAGVASAQEPTGVSSEVERTASTSPQEKISYAESSNNEIREAEKTISRLLEQARKDGDAEAIECLINKLTSVRALLQVSESAEVSMRDAIAAGEDEKANHEFRKIAVAVSKTRQLMAEAQRCAANEDLAPGETYVDWESRLDGGTTFDDNADTIDIDVDVPPISPFL